MTCVCSLAGTAACASCQYNPNSIGKSNNFISWKNFTTERTCEIKRLYGSDWSKCSECHAELPPYPYCYCPNCGAKVSS